MDAVQYLKARDKRLAKVIDQIGEFSYVGYNDNADSFLFLAREIVGQMISASVKKVIVGRLERLCCNNITPNTILNLSVEELRSTGLSKSKISYIQNLSTTFLENTIDFDSLGNLPDKEIISVLTSVKGIGNWTAKMYLMFFLQREDILPFEDGAFLQSYKWLYSAKSVKPESVTRKCKKWKPYSSIGARYLYKALDLGLTRIPIKEFLANSI